MKVFVKKGDIEKQAAHVLVIPLFSDIQNSDEDLGKVDNILGRAISQALEDNAYLSKEGSISMFFTNKRLRADRVLLAGLGKSAELTTEKIRKLGGSIARHLTGKNAKDVAVLGFGLGLKNIPLDRATQALVEGFLLGNYTFDTYKTKKDDDNEKNDKKDDNEKTHQSKIERLPLIPQNEFDTDRMQDGADLAVVLSENVLMVRELINKPANIVTPEYMAKFAKDLSRNTKIKCKILNLSEIKKEKMGMILAVAQGSKNEPTLVKLEYYGARGKPTYAIVGKGVCFDTGGVNLKPTGYIEDMKDDMSGAAAVFGIVKAAAQLKLPVNLVGIAPCVENHISGSASRPSDIVRAASGKYVEIGNTDAEGRLILGDAIDYALKSKPDAIIDIATLTGACVVALGKEISGVMGNNQELMDKIMEAGKQTDELMWQLPLLDFHKEHVKSDVADIKNVGKGKGEAGSISGAAFLWEFVGKTPWAHLDIAGTAFSSEDKGWISKGGTGVPVRALVHFLQHLA